MKMNIKKLTLTAFFAAIAVAGSLFSFPVLGSRCSPIQHLVNVMCAILLGPWYGLAAAFLAALLRNILGLGTLLAFPGSMCGALLSGVLYQWMKKVTGSLYRRSGRYKYYRRYAVLSNRSGADGQSDSSIIYICGAVFNQHCRRNNHGYCNYHDDTENESIGKNSAADKRVIANLTRTLGYCSKNFVA